MFQKIPRLMENGDRNTLNCLKLPFSGHLLYTAESCTSTMDLAWNLHAESAFPEWSSVLAERQDNGRGQFGRNWSSPSGNLYASLCLPEKKSGLFPLTPLLLAYAIQKALSDQGVGSEFKWPNDILVCRKKVGGILVEEKSGISIAGIGINLSVAPIIQNLKQSRSFPAACLREFGLSLKPHEIWLSIIREISSHFQFFSCDTTIEKLLQKLESNMAFLGERVVFRSVYGDEFPAVVAGLSGTGGIRLITPEGEKIHHSGSIFPVFY